MQAPLLHRLHDQHLWLSPLRALFWEEQKTLIASDLHFGKTGHFRKAGIAVPQAVYKEDLQRLVALLHHFRPESLLVVGDFFHSRANTELDLFSRWRADFTHLDVVLVRGNHDILHDKWYAQNNIRVVEETLTLAPFLFSHDRCEDSPGLYGFCGHLHPGISLQGAGRQSLRLPCFYFGRSHCILPAFSKFTGTVAVDPRRDEQVYAIVENKLMKLQ